MAGSWRHFRPLVAAAAATTTLRVGTFVLDNDFRHPAALAKEAATVDLLTEGRLELGIGAGWNLADYAKTGIPFESAGVRGSAAWSKRCRSSRPFSPAGR